MRAPVCVSLSVWIHLSFYVYILFCIHSSIYKQLFLTIFARHFYESANRSLSFNLSILKESIIFVVFCFSTLNFFGLFLPCTALMKSPLNSYSFWTVFLYCSPAAQQTPSFSPYFSLPISHI